LLENSALRPRNQYFFVKEEQEDGGGQLDRNDCNHSFNSFGVPTYFQK
jgi:hypothetical protein